MKPRTIRELSRFFPAFDKDHGQTAQSEDPWAVIRLMRRVCDWADEQNASLSAGVESPEALVEAYVIVVYGAQLDYIDCVADEARGQHFLKERLDSAFDERYLDRLCAVWSGLCALLPGLNPNACEAG